MALNSKLAKEFAQIIKEDKTASKDTTVYGTAVKFNGKMYVKIDGSERMTPVETTTSIKEGDRVTVLIKAHSATVTGNVSDPASSTSDKKATDEKVNDLSGKVTEFGTIVAGKVSTDQLNAAEARIESLETYNVTVKENLKANSADIKNLNADNVTINQILKVNKVAIDNLNTKVAVIDTLDTTYATIKDLKATNGTIYNLSGNYADFKRTTTDTLNALNGNFKSLDSKYANIDFSNISKATMGEFYANSGLIKNVVVGDQAITGELIGVTIKGDLIEGGTIVADKLVMKGNNGLYYKLNTDGNIVSSEQTAYNSINGRIITAKSIAAEKIAVNDLVAFGATIAKYHITKNALYSGTKETVDNTTRGVFLGEDGHVNFGDSNNYIKFFTDTDGKYKLKISADSLEFSTGKNLLDSLNSIDDKVNAIKSIDTVTIGYLVGDSGTEPPAGTWSDDIPVIPNGKFLWTQTITTYTDKSFKIGYSVSSKGDRGIQGPKGEKGDKGDQGIQGPKGPTGATGKGIKSTSVTYQASASATSCPTGTWQSSPQTTLASLPYMWTRTIITYSDNTTSTSYSVGCTPEGVSVGGRNLIRGSGKLGDDFAAGNGTAVTGGYNGNKAISTNTAWTGYYIHLKDIVNRAKITTGTTVTISIYVSTTSKTEVMTPAIYLYRGNGNEQTGAFGALKLIAGKWVKISKTYTITSAISNLLNTTRFEASGNTTFTILWSSPKLEIGNKATDWTPAPEDQVSKGDVVNQINSELKISGNSIALTTGHFTINAKNLTLDSAGNAVFSGKIKAAAIEGGTISGATITGAAGEFTKSFEVLIPYEGEEPGNYGNWRMLITDSGLIIGFEGYPGGSAKDSYILFNPPQTSTAGGSINTGDIVVHSQGFSTYTTTASSLYAIDNSDNVKSSIHVKPDSITLNHNPSFITMGNDLSLACNYAIYVKSAWGICVESSRIGKGYVMHGWDQGAHSYNCWWDGSKLHFCVDKGDIWNSSDIRLKRDISSIRDEYIEAVGKVDMVQYRINRQGYNDNTLHFGVIAQDISKELMCKGYSDSGLAMIFKDKIHMDNPTLYYGMDYEQFLILRLAYNEKIIKQMQKEIAKLKGEQNENI